MTHLACVGGVALRSLLLLSAALCAFVAAVPSAAAAPVADFTWSPNPAIVDQRTLFEAVQSPDIVGYAWDLDGNGRYDDRGDRIGTDAPRTFQRIQTYRIGLIVVDAAGNWDEARKDVPVVAPGTPGTNLPPEASFVFFPEGPVAGQPITFVSTSTDADSPIPASSLHWDLNGDGTFGDAEGTSATTSFPLPGPYTVSLRITTNVTDVATLVLNVGMPGVPGTALGQRGLPLLSPFPVVRIAGDVSRRGARIRRLTVDAPPGTGVRVRCAGRGCPFKRVMQTVSSRLVAGRALPPSRLVRIRRLEGRLLRAGATLRLFVTRLDAVGKYTRFRIRKGKSPARADMCLIPGSGRPVSCPSR